MSAMLEDMLEDVIVSFQNLHLEEKMSAMLEDVIVSFQNLHLEEQMSAMLQDMLEDAIVSFQNLSIEEHKESELELTTELSQQAPHSLEEVEEMTGYRFKDKELLKEGFTYRSYINQQLEYISDSVLNLLVATLHYLDYPNLAPGGLTRLRSANVDTEALARAALKCNLDEFLRHQRPLLPKQIAEFRKEMDEYPSPSIGMIDPPKVLADLLESLIGAIFIDTDRSLDTIWEVAE